MCVCMSVCLCRSCRAGLLLQCDYCPLLFHWDCLNPPLTALPSGRWMCPNHVEHALVCLRISVLSALWSCHTEFLEIQGRPVITMNTRYHCRWIEMQWKMPKCSKILYGWRCRCNFLHWLNIGCKLAQFYFTEHAINAIWGSSADEIASRSTNCDSLYWCSAQSVIIVDRWNRWRVC